MITPQMVLRGKEYISSSRLRSAVYNELVKRGIVNASTNKPFTKAHIDQVFRGDRENVEIEEVFISMILEKKRKRAELLKEYKEEFADVDTKEKEIDNQDK